MKKAILKIDKRKKRTKRKIGKENICVIYGCNNKYIANSPTHIICNTCIGIYKRKKGYEDVKRYRAKQKSKESKITQNKAQIC